MNQYLISKLKEGRINKKLKQSDVTQFTGIKNTTLSNYENGITEPDIDTFLQLCELYELNYAEILAEAYGLSVQGKDFKIRPSEIEVAKKYRFISDHSQNGTRVVDTVLDNEYSIAEQLEKQKARIEELESSKTTVIDIQPYQKDLTRHIYPYLGKIACTGTGFFFDDIPTDTIKAPYVKGADFVIGINGDSMEPDYHDGEKLYLCKVESLQIGDTGIFTIGNECFLKELGEDGLISRNKDYDDILGNEDIRLVGKVIGKVEI